MIAPGAPVVGVDLGGTKVAAALVGRDGGLLGEVVRRPSRAKDGPQVVLDTVADVVRAAAGDRPYAALGIGSAGVVDRASGTIVSSTDAFTDWPGTRVAAGLRDRLGVPVEVVNDVDAYALGEAFSGAGRDLATFLMVAVGTGVGGSIVLDGRLRTGAHHVAGEIGHIPVPGAEGARCACGRLGHLEAIAAGPAIERRYADRRPPLDGARIARAAADGDECAQAVLREAAAALGRGIAGIASTLDPDGIVIGGSVSGAGPVWWSTLRETLRAEVIEPLQDLPVRAVELGDLAPIIGAASATGLLIKEQS